MKEHDDIMGQVRESFSGLCMDMPVEQVFAAGRVRRRRRLSGLTAAVAATAGAVAAMTLTAGGPGPARPGNPPAPSPGSVQLAAFTVTSGPGDDNTTLILRKGPQYRLDPSALRQALAKHGIPALVTVGTFCRTKSGETASSGQLKHPPAKLADGADALVISSHDVPPGTRLSIGYFPNQIRMALIKDGAPLSCSSTFQQPAARITPAGTPIRVGKKANDIRMPGAVG
jgi:hypothetical protein